MAFEFATATRIVFGSGKLSEVRQAATSMGTRALVVIGSSPERAAPLLDVLSGLPVELFQVSHEPTVDLVQAGIRQAQEAGCDLVISFGGGSVLDAGKAIAALMANPGDPVDYLEVIGHGKPLDNLSYPYIAIPTTAGTGAEVTRNAVLGVPEQRVKVSLRSPLMLPRLALVDPALTCSLPPQATASTGMDALTQVIEPFVSHRANPLTDGLCREGMTRAARSLRRAFEHGDDLAAREDMSLASLFSGLALANAGLGAVHGFAGPVGGMFPAPHGAICARLLPIVAATNIAALSERNPEGEALRRYHECARILTGNTLATALHLVEWLTDLRDALRIPPLSAYGVTETDFPALIQKSAEASSMKGNPIQLIATEMHDILSKAL